MFTPVAFNRYFPLWPIAEIKAYSIFMTPKLSQSWFTLPALTTDAFLSPVGDDPCYHEPELPRAASFIQFFFFFFRRIHIGMEQSFAFFLLLVVCYYVSLSHFVCPGD